MKKVVFPALLALLALGAPAANAQYYGPYYSRPPIFPGFGPGIGGYGVQPFGYQQTYGSGALPYTGQTYGAPFGGLQTFGTWPTAPGVGTQLAPGTSVVAQPYVGLSGQATSSSILDISGTDTGHPTRFMAYSQYFLNETGSAGGLNIGQVQQGAAIGGIIPQQTPIGTAPPRGRPSTTTPRPQQ
jgi:hypothetical protein